MKNIVSENDSWNGIFGIQIDLTFTMWGFCGAKITDTELAGIYLQKYDTKFA